MPGARLLQRIPAITGGISTQAEAIRFPDQLQDAENVVFSLREGAKRRAGTVALAALFNSKETPGISVGEDEQYRLHLIQRDDAEQYVVVYGRGVLSVLDIKSERPRWAEIEYASQAARDYIEWGSPRAEEFRMTTVADTTIIANTKVPTRVLPDTDGAEIDPARMPVKLVRTSIDPLRFEVDLIEWAGRPYHLQVIDPVATPSGYYRISYKSTDPEGTGPEEWTLNIPVLAKASQDAPINEDERGGVEQYLSGNGRTADDYIDYDYPERSKPWKAIVGIKSFPYGKVICTGGTLAQGKRIYLRFSPDIGIKDLVKIEHPSGWIPPQDGVTPIISAKSQLRVMRGDDDMNPAPELIRLGLPITEIGYHRNRLIIASDEYIAMSQADDVFNFYAEDDSNIVDSDPIDVQLAANDVCVVEHVMPYRNTMLVTTKAGQQFELLSTDVLGPDSVAILPTTRYPTQDTRPLQFRDRVYFAGAGDDSSIVYEYYYTDTTQASTAADITKHVGGLIPPRMLRLQGEPNTDSIYCLAVPRPTGGNISTVQSGSLFWNTATAWIGQRSPRPWDDVTVAGTADVVAVEADRVDMEWETKRMPFAEVLSPAVGNEGGIAGGLGNSCVCPGLLTDCDGTIRCGGPGLGYHGRHCNTLASPLWPPVGNPEALLDEDCITARNCVGAMQSATAEDPYCMQQLANGDCSDPCKEAIRGCLQKLCYCEPICEMPCGDVIIPANYDGYPWTGSESSDEAPISDYPQLFFDAWGNRRAGPPTKVGPQPEIIPPRTINGHKVHIVYHCVRRDLLENSDNCQEGRKSSGCILREEICADNDSVCTEDCPNHPFDPNLCSRGLPGTGIWESPDWIELINPYPENTPDIGGPPCDDCCLPIGQDTPGVTHPCPSFRGFACNLANNNCPVGCPPEHEVHVRYLRLNQYGVIQAGEPQTEQTAVWRCPWPRTAWLTTRHPADDWPPDDPPCITAVIQYPPDAFLEPPGSDPTEEVGPFSNGSIYAYRQYSVGNERRQSAWSVWNFGDGDDADEIMDIAIADDKMLLVRKGFDTDSQPWLAIETIDLSEDPAPTPGLDFAARLDHTIQTAAGVHDPARDVTKWTLGDALANWRDASIDTGVIVDQQGDTYEHRPPETEGGLGLVVSPDGRFVEIPGNHEGMLAIFGRSFRSSITLSRVYMRAEQPLDDGRTKITKMLVTHTGTNAYRVRAIPRWDFPRDTVHSSDTPEDGTLTAWVMADTRDIILRLESLDVRPVSWTAIEIHGMYGSGTAN